MITDSNKNYLVNNQPAVTVGIVEDTKLTFLLDGLFTIEDEIVSGEQNVCLKNGLIEWKEKSYKEICFVPQSEQSHFIFDNVTIGINFHWERKERQVFEGKLYLKINEGKIFAINELPIESYLKSVISSEMRADASLELLKAHAVISRSWLLVQQENRNNHSKCSTSHDDELSEHCGSATEAQQKITQQDAVIKWYDRSEHLLFDVCADDHCQRYQGITRQTRDTVARAIDETSGEVMTYDNKVCDARFSKCCGGHSEEYRYCWDDADIPYLKSVADEYCNTSDTMILRQILNDYDLETKDFHDWEVSYSQEEISKLVNTKLPKDIGIVQDIIPIERGKSGRLSLIKIVGTKGEYYVGKELEIRRVLSSTHLKSSNFVVEKKYDDTGALKSFVLHGNGWGHGVGLCQIGAAVMAERGFTYVDILKHYYHDVDITKMW